MAANEALNALSTTDANNTPNDTDVIGTTLDDELRSVKANIARSAREETTSTITTAATLAVTALNKIIPVTGNTTVTLPPVATAKVGFRVSIMKTDASNTVTIDGDGSETINGAANYTLETQYEVVQLVTNGTRWFVESTSKDTGFVKTSGDAMTGDLTFGDNNKAIFGAGSDLQIYHDGSSSLISDQGTGPLLLRATDFQMTNAAGSQFIIQGADGGAVTLYHAGSGKLATTASGIDVTGTVTDDGATHDGDVTFTGASYNVVWDKSDNALEFADNTKAIFGTGSDLQIFHDGTNSYIQEGGAGDLLIMGDFVSIRDSGFKYLLQTTSDDGVQLYYDNVAKFSTDAAGIDVTGTVTSDGADLDGAVTINEAGASVDFRVESNNDTHMLFVDGSADAVGIGTSSPLGKLKVAVGDNAPAASGNMNTGVVLESASASRALNIGVNNTAGYSWINAAFSNNSNVPDNLVFMTGTNERARIDTDGELHIGSSAVTSQDAKLQVTGSQTNQITIKSSGGTGFTQGGIAIEGHASEGTPGNRGQGIYYFNEGNDRTYYSGTLYNNGTVWGVGTTTGTSLALAAADNGNACIRVTSAGNLEVVGALSKGSGSFKIDHPLPAKSDTHHLVHSFVEGPQADLIYRGKVDLVDGSATVNIDTVAGMTSGTFVALCTDVQCFTSNESGWTAVKGSVSGNTLTITAQDNACTDTISWMVVGERKDAHMVATDWTDDNGKVIVEPLKPVI
jgi:hypothetical protein